MEAKIIGMCRGEGRGYVAIEIKGAIDGARLTMVSHADGGTWVPSILYPLRADCERSVFVAVIPLLCVKSQTLRIAQSRIEGLDGFHCDLVVNMATLKWQSRASRFVNKRLVDEMRFVDSEPDCERISIQPVRFTDDGDACIMRVMYTLPGLDSHLETEVLDERGKSTQIHPIAMGSRNLPAKEIDGVSVLECIYSYRLPKDGGAFCLAARDASGKAKESFFCMEEEAFHRELDFTARSTISAEHDPYYPSWFEEHAASAELVERQRSVHFDYEPEIDIAVVAAAGATENDMRKTIQSASAQDYANAHVLLVSREGNASAGNVYAEVMADPSSCGVKRIDAEKDDLLVNAALARSDADFVAFIDAGDTLEANALFEYVRAMNESACPARDIDLLYCDEDRISKKGEHESPCFKPDWSPELMLSYNYVAHMLMVRCSVFDETGASSFPFDSASDYDLALAACGKARCVLHVPGVLYHVSAQHGRISHADDPREIEAGRCALQAYLGRSGKRAEVENGKLPGRYRIAFQLDEQPKVSIVIPSHDNVALLKTCITSLLDTCTYENFDIVVVENGSSEQETFDYYEAIQERCERVRVVSLDVDGFNFSKIVNYGVSCADGEYVLLLNNDTEVITEDFIERMLGFFAFDDVAIVGAKLLYRDDTMQHAGVLVGALGAASHYHYGLSNKDDGYFGRAQVAQNVSCVTGACQLIRKSVYDAVGGYDEEFPVGYNDVDFCLKVCRAGYRVVLEPDAMLHHYEFSTRGETATAEQHIRDDALLRYRWTSYFVDGDPYYNKNLDYDNLYFGLK